VTNDRLTPAPAEPPLRVRAECLAAAQVIQSLEARDLRLRMDVDECAGTVQVTVFDARGRETARLAGRNVLELVCGPSDPR
jgi:hypothetical protein